MPAGDGDDGHQVTDPATGHTLHFAAAEEGDTAEAASGVARVLPLSAITDRNGNRIDLHYTGGMLAEVAHSAGYHLDIETHAGLIVSIRLREAGQTLITYRYDEHHHLTEVINSSGLPLRFTYDEHGRMARWTDRIGAWYAYTYDDQGRCVHGTGSHGVYDVEIEYRDGGTVARDSLGHAATYHYNELLQVVREVDPLGHETCYEWDRYGHLPARTDPLGRTDRYAYDEHGLLTSVVRPDGAVSHLARDQAGRPATVVDSDGRVHVRDHDQHGNLPAARITPDGARLEFGYDTELRADPRQQSGRPGLAL
ncbi:hypothetical protein ACFPZ3_57905 [Nonomuraea insulae]|uniref:YD repeat-containing protein n=1 Tax=Nonomuraea insulae TaxID=1616787 RepID=A0ABW1D733_9ACTN